MPSMPNQPLTGKSLEQALLSGALEQPALELVGMVKAAEEDGKISFSRTDCESWIDVPTDLIESAEQLGHNRCQDHSHPVFRLSLKESNDPAAQVLAALLASSARFPTQAGADQTALPPPFMDPFTAEAAQVGQGGGSGFNSGCVRSCQWSCGAAGVPARLCWYFCAWLCHPRVEIGDVRL